MPHMVRAYIRSVGIGMLLACCFVAALLALDVGHLRHLILASDIGWLAVLMLVVFNTIVFGGVQFALVVMAQAENPPGPGRLVRLWMPRRLAKARVAVPASSGR